MTIVDLTTDLVTLPPEGEIGIVEIGNLTLENGEVIEDAFIAVQRWGKLSPDRDNVVVVLHALTGDSHITGPAGPDHPTPGWWDGVAGPGAPIDTDRWCAISTNVLGGCMGSTGPREEMTDAATRRGLGRPWGTDFPNVTIRDMVRAQRRLLEHLGIPKLFAVVGGSMGGMQALEWAATFPELVYACVPVATAALHSAQNIAFHEVGRAAIHSDPAWRNGRYWETGAVPARCDGGRGFLLIGDPPNLTRYVLPGNNYHVYDYSLFWANVRADAARRLQAFQAR